jgi:hypothetical protein
MFDLSKLPQGAGRTTAQAHFYIAEAISNPHINISIMDHDGTRDSNLILLQKINSITNKMGYLGISIDYHECSITYKLDHIR